MTKVKKFPQTRKTIKLVLRGDRSRKRLKLRKGDINRLILVYPPAVNGMYQTPYLKRGTDGKVFANDVEPLKPRA